MGYLVCLVLGLAAGMALPLRVSAATLPYWLLTLLCASLSLLRSCEERRDLRFEAALLLTMLGSSAVLTYIGTLYSLPLWQVTATALCARIFVSMEKLPDIVKSKQNSVCNRNEKQT